MLALAARLLARVQILPKRSIERALLAKRLQTAQDLFLRGLTFELRRAQRQDGKGRTETMYTVPQAGPCWPAVGPRLERGVRPHPARLARKAEVSTE